jgi:hypothetical protein
MERSPSLDEYKDGMPERLPDSSARRKRAWIAIAVLAALALVFGVLNLARSGAFARVAGVGGVKGVVVDETGQPLPAEIFVLGTNLSAETDASGYFEIQGVPAGDQTLVIGYLAQGTEVPVRVAGGETRDLGQVRVSTAEQRDRLLAVEGGQ